MHIRITGHAEVSLDDGKLVTARSMIRQLADGRAEEIRSDFLDSDLADLGFSGGTIKFSYDAGGRSG